MSEPIRERRARGEGWRPNEEERRVGKRKGSGVGGRTEGKIRDTSDHRHGDGRLLLLALSTAGERERESETRCRERENHESSVHTPREHAERRKSRARERARVRARVDMRPSLIFVCVRERERERVRASSGRERPREGKSESYIGSKDTHTERRKGDGGVGDYQNGRARNLLHVLLFSSCSSATSTASIPTPLFLHLARARRAAPRGNRQAQCRPI